MNVRQMAAMVVLGLVLAGLSPMAGWAQDAAKISRILQTQEQISRAVEALDRNLARPDARDRIDELVTEAKAVITLLEDSRWAILYFQCKDARTVRELTKKAHFALVTGRDLEVARQHLQTVRDLTSKMLNQTMSRRAS